MRIRIAGIAALLSLVIAATTWAAGPPLLPLQGVLTDADGVPLATAVSVRFSLHTAETDGTEVWYETQTITPVDGLFAAYLGQGTGSAFTLATFRDNGELWLEVKVGSDPPMPRVRLGSVAYAAYSEYCGNVPPHTHPASDLPAGVVIGAQACAGSDKVRGVSSTGAIVCSPDLGTGADTLGQLSCTSGQTVKWNGSIWTCADDNNSGGTLTAVNAGDPLIATPTGTTVTVGLQPCGAYETLRYQSSQWQCSPDVQSIVTPAAGGLALSTANATYTLTLRGCANGEILKYNAGTTSWGCAADANSGGDITDVLATANGGLTVTNSAGPQPSLGLMACTTTGQILKYTAGTGWACGNDNNSGGTVTSVATGAGLTGGPITGAGTIAIATGGVTNAMLANSTVGVTAGTGLSGGGTVALGGSTSIALVTPVTIANGGTGGGTAAGARSNLGAAASGVNSDITGLTGLSTQDAVQIGPYGATAGNTGELRFLELAANGPNYVGFKAVDALVGNVIWTLPAADGTANQVLRTDGAGHLSWVSSTGGTVTSVATGAGLTGGPITGSGTISIATGGVTNAMLVNSGVTINTGGASGLSGGGTVALGGALSLAIPGGGVTNTMLQNSGVTLNQGTGIVISTSALSLGGSTTISIASPVAVGNGGTGATDAATARANLGAGTVSSVAPGNGLTGATITTTGSLAVDFTGSTGTANAAARADHNHTGTYWGVKGTAGTDPTTDYIGTSDAVGLELRVNGTRALRLDPAAGGANVVGGDPSNAVGVGVAGAAIGGGANNLVSASYAVVPGGSGNAASGAYSFAAGRRAQADFDGCFVWGDSTNADVSCGAADQFMVRANGGAVFAVNNARWTQLYDDGTDLITTSTGAHLTVGGAWTNSSDRNRKEGFVPVDPRAVLARVASLPVSTWSYKAESPAIRHMGPMAQDFRAAFGLGTDERSIGTIDADGVALAAIQGLDQGQGELRAENARLRAQVQKLEARVAQLDRLEQRVAHLEQARPAGAGARDFGLGAFGLLVAGGLVVARRRRH